MPIAPRIFLKEGAAARAAAERRAERLLVFLVDAGEPRLSAQRGTVRHQILGKILGQIMSQILGQVLGQVRFKGHVRAPCAFPANAFPASAFPKG